MGWKDFWKKKPVTVSGVEGAPPSPEEVTKKVADGPFEAMWALAQHRWDERQLHLLSQVKNWQKMSQLSLAVAAAGILGAMYYAAQPRAVPVYVEVDKVGNTLKVQQLNGAGPVVDIDRIVLREVQEFIAAMRSVPGDLQVQKRYKDYVFARLKSGSAADTAVRSFLTRERIPRRIAETQTIEVEVKTRIPVSKSSYSVEWREQAVSLKGEPFGPPQCFKGLLTWERVVPETEAAIAANPVGWLTNSWSYSKIEGSTC